MLPVICMLIGVIILIIFGIIFGCNRKQSNIEHYGGKSTALQTTVWESYDEIKVDVNFDNLQYNTVIVEYNEGWWNSEIVLAILGYLNNNKYDISISDPQYIDNQWLNNLGPNSHLAWENGVNRDEDDILVKDIDNGYGKILKDMGKNKFQLV